MARKQSEAPAISKKPDATRKETTAATDSTTAAGVNDKRTEKLSQRLADSMPRSKPDTQPSGKTTVSTTEETTRRVAKPARNRIAANDDLPSIGGLIYSLQQRPARTPFYVAFGASAIWIFMCLGAGLFLFNERLSTLSSIGDMLRDPAALALGATFRTRCPVLVFSTADLACAGIAPDGVSHDGSRGASG